MVKGIKLFGAALALLSTAQAQAATPKSCITQGELRGLVGYALPDVLRHVATTCRPLTPKRGYIRDHLPDLIDALAADRDAAWPGAKAAFLKFAGDKDSDGAKAMQSLSDETLRPIVDELFVKELKIKLDAGICLDVQDVLEVLAPLEPGGSVQLVTVVLGVVGRNDNKLPVCPRTGK